MLNLSLFSLFFTKIYGNNYLLLNESPKFNMKVRKVNYYGKKCIYYIAYANLKFKFADFESFVQHVLHFISEFNLILCGVVYNRNLIAMLIEELPSIFNYDVHGIMVQIIQFILHEHLLQVNRWIFNEIIQYKKILNG